MKMKKLTVIFLIMGFVLLTGCKKDAKKENTVEQQTAESISEEENTDTAQSDDKEEPETPVSDEIEEAELLQLFKDHLEVDYMNPDTYNYYMEYADEKIVLSEEDAEKYPALAKTLEEELSKRNKTYQSELDSYIEGYNEMKEFGFDGGFYSNSKLSIKRADSLVLSICDFSSSFLGGAHGMYGSFGYNYDPQTGKLLKFSDVVSDPVAFLKLANDKIQSGYSSDLEAPSNLDDFMSDYDTSIIWTVDYQGVKIYFNPYTLGSYALGSVETEIYFNEAPELFNDRYLNIPESYVMEISSDDSSGFDINKDGKIEKISIISKYDDDYDYSYVTGADIEVGDAKFSFDNAVEHCYFVSDKGKNYILASVANEGGYWNFYTIDLSDMSMDADNTTPAFLASLYDEWNDDGERMEYTYTEAVFTDPDKVLLETYIQYLGTMTGRDYYCMGEGPNLVPQTGVYSFDTNSVITAKLDIDCEKVDLDGNVTGKAVIKKGSRLVVRRGDGKTFADLIEVPADSDIIEQDYDVNLNSDLYIEDADIIYRVYGELGEYGSMAVINGQDEYDVFSDIMYYD